LVVLVAPGSESWVDQACVHPIAILRMSLFPTRDLALAHPLPSTVLKWRGDGELSELDRRSILHRLLAADPFASQLQQGIQEVFPGHDPATLSAGRQGALAHRSSFS